MILKSIDPTDKTIIDVLSVGTGIGAFMSWLPELAAILTIIWTILRIYETDTVQRLLGKEIKNEQETNSE